MPHGDNGIQLSCDCQQKEATKKSNPGMLEAAGIAAKIPEIAHYTSVFFDTETREFYVDWKDDIDRTEIPYGCGLPKELVEETKKRKPRENPMKLFEQDNPELLEKIRKGEYTEADLIEYYKKHILKTPLINYQDDENKIHIYHLPARGSEYYNNNIKNRLRYYEENIKTIADEMFFITLTFNRKEINGDNIESWVKVKKILPDFLRELNREAGGGYIAVKEAQKDGTVHVHILYANPNIETKSFEWKGKVRTNNHDFRKKVKELWGNNGFIDITVLSGENIIGYITKYINKGFKKAQTDWEGLTDKERETECKGLLGLALSQATGNRLFTASRNVSKRPATSCVEAQETFTKQLGNLLGKTEQEGSGTIDLKSSLIIPECVHYKQVLLVTNMKDKEFIGQWEGMDLRTDSQIWRLIQGIGLNCGCPGCIFSKVIEKVRKETGYYDVVERYRAEIKNQSMEITGEVSKNYAIEALAE